MGSPCGTVPVSLVSPAPSYTADHPLYLCTIVHGLAARVYTGPFPLWSATHRKSEPSPSYKNIGRMIFGLIGPAVVLPCVFARLSICTYTRTRCKRLHGFAAGVYTGFFPTTQRAVSPKPSPAGNTRLRTHTYAAKTPERSALIQVLFRDIIQKFLPIHSPPQAGRW